MNMRECGGCILKMMEMRPCWYPQSAIDPSNQINLFARNCFVPNKRRYWKMWVSSLRSFCLHLQSHLAFPYSHLSSLVSSCSILPPPSSCHPMLFTFITGDGDGSSVGWPVILANKANFFPRPWLPHSLHHCYGCGCWWGFLLTHACGRVWFATWHFLQIGSIFFWILSSWSMILLGDHMSWSMIAKFEKHLAKPNSSCHNEHSLITSLPPLPISLKYSWILGFSHASLISFIAFLMVLVHEPFPKCSAAHPKSSVGVWKFFQKSVVLPSLVNSLCFMVGSFNYWSKYYQSFLNLVKCLHSHLDFLWNQANISW